MADSFNAMDELIPGQHISDGQISMGSYHGMHDSPFSKLPPEVRNNIWEHVFENLWETTTVALLRTNRCLGGHKKLALLLTCEQINREATGLAWRDVTGALDYGRTALDLLAVLHATQKSRTALAHMAGHQRLLESQLGPKLQRISRLVCGEADLSELIERDYWNRSSASRLPHAVPTLLPRLMGLREVIIYDTMVHYEHHWAVYPMSHFTQARVEHYRTSSRRHLSSLKDLVPQVTAITIAPLISGYGLDQPITWQCIPSHFTHAASGTVWDYNAETGRELE